MKKEKNREIKIETITGEAYYDYTEDSAMKKDSGIRRLASWFATRVTNHLDRMESLRVYDQSR